MHKRRERGHILNLVQNASRTLAFTSWLLEDFEGWLRVRRGWLDVYSTQTTTNKHQNQYNNHRVKRSARETSYDDRRKGRDGVGRGDTVLGSKRSGTERLRTKGLKDRDPRVGGKRSARANSLCNTPATPDRR